MTEGYGSGSYGAGPWGVEPDVTITGPAAVTIIVQAWPGVVGGTLSNLQITASGHTVSFGSADPQVFQSVALSDFFYVGGLSSSPTVDPLETCVLAKSYPTESNSAWVRPTLTALAPKGFWTAGTEDAFNAGTGSQLWPRPGRAIVGGFFNSTANTEQHFIDDVQFEMASTASAYDNPRDTKIALIPDRINATPKQLFTTGTTSPLVATNTTLSITAAGLKAVWNTSPASFKYPVTIPNDLNKGWATISLYVFNAVVGLSITPVASVAYTQGYQVIDTLTTRVWASYPIDATGVADFNVAPTTTGFPGTESFLNGQSYTNQGQLPTGGSYVGTNSVMSNFMAEAAPAMGTYFDATYIYTNDILVGASGAVSFFDNRKVKNYRLTQILNQTLPIGATFTLSYNTY